MTDDSATPTSNSLITSNDALRRGSMLMSLGTFASRVSGQVRAMLLVAIIGSVGTVADAFDVGNRMPNLLFALISAGILQAVLIPQLLKAMAAHNAQERLDKLLTFAGLSIAALTAVIALLMPQLVHLMTLSGEWSDTHRAFAVTFALWCVPQLFFYGLFSLLGQALNARGYFGAFGWAPVANNVVSMIGFGLFWLLWGATPAGGIDDISGWSTAQTALLAGTATLGIAAQALLLIWPLRRIGFRWRFRLGVRGIGLRSAGKVVGWTLGAVALDLIGNFFLVNTTSAAGRVATDCRDQAQELTDLTEQALALAACPVIAGNAAYSQALMIYFLPHSLIVVSIVTALFPRMSTAAAAGDLDEVRRDLSVGLRTAGVFSVFSSAVLLVLARPITKALLPTASEQMVNVGAPVLQAMSLGLVALGMTVMVKRMYFAFEDGKGIFVIQVVATTVMVSTLWLAAQRIDFQYWAIAAAGAYALGVWVSVLLRVRGMSRKLNGMDGFRITHLYVRAIMAAMVAGVAGWWVAQQLGAYQVRLSWMHSLTITAAAGSVMLFTYLFGLKVMKVRELDAAMAPILRRIRRRPSKP
ncbi:MAG: murein biosynthesis protein MurJ [Promicromonosporaceae bacterium]|nr:murein biosynthesis protein MurJ [Promicromonosporaceae bacterium]